MKAIAPPKAKPPFAPISAKTPPTSVICCVRIRSCSTPTTRALMALMLFHAARLDARLDHRGCILLMEEQDRTRWDQRLIQRAKEFFDQSAEGTSISTFHLEAGIALYHCSAKSYAETNWPAILRLYDCDAHDSSFAGIRAEPSHRRRRNRRPPGGNSRPARSRRESVAQ